MKIRVKDIQSDSELEVDIKDIISTNAYYTSTKTAYSLNYKGITTTNNLSYLATLVISKKEHDRIKKLMRNGEVKENKSLRQKKFKLIDNPFYGIEI